MRNVKRYYKEGYLYFLTHVTYNRERILVENFDLLWNSFEKYRNECSFNLIAWVVLPDHMYFIIDSGLHDLSDLMKKIKLSFGMHYLKRHNRKKGRIWHNRYWDHQIRDEKDLHKHIDYIHYNPVKHNYVTTPRAWKFSSYTLYLEKEFYPIDWGTNEDVMLDGKYGE